MKSNITFLKNFTFSPEKIFLLINFIFFLVFLFLNLSISYDKKNWEMFPDCYDYLAQSNLNFFSKEFFFPTTNVVLFPRGFSIPLIYKLAGSDPSTIVFIQKVIYSISVAFFSYSVSTIFKKNSLKYIWLLSCYLIFSNWENLGWTQTLLSESLGLSFFLLWLGSFILIENKKSNMVISFHIICLLLLSFTRDNMPYFILAFYTCNLILKLFLKEKIVFASVIVFIAAIIFFVHNKSVKDGNRYRLPVTNTIITRILPNDNYFTWFKEKGMPQADSLKKNFVNINPMDESRIRVYNMYNDSTYKPFFNWVITQGKSTYIEFMLTHLDYFFLIHENNSELDYILFYDSGLYIGPPMNYSEKTFSILHGINPANLLVLLFPICLLLFRARKIFLRFFSLTFVFLIMVLLNYNADTFEVGRHMYLNHCILYLLALIGILLIVDNPECYRFSFKKSQK